MTRPRIDSSRPETWVHLRNDPDLRAAREEVAAASAPEAVAQDSVDPIAALSKRWQREYQRDARKREKQLLRDGENPRADESALIGAAAQDLALADQLWKSQAQLAARVGALIDNPRHVLALARALKEVSACRAAATSRAEQLLLAVSTVRAQRLLANPEGKPRLRRVA